MKKLLIYSMTVLLVSCASKKRADFESASENNSAAIKQEFKTCPTTVNEKTIALVKRIINSLNPNSKDEQKYEFSFLEYDIKEALIELSSRSSKSIVFGENISGMVSLNINNRTFEEALEMIIKTGPYDYKKFENYYYVGLSERSEKSWDKLTYKYQFPLQHIRPEDFIITLPENLRSLVTPENNKNSVHIKAPRSEFLEIVKHIKKTDTKRAQIKIQLTIIELNKDSSSFLGQTFQSGALADYMMPNVDNLSIPSLISSQNYLSFLSTIRILKQKGLANIKATPTLLTLENQPAKFQTLNKDLIANRNQNFNLRPEFVDSGILFQIIPRILNENTIRLTIKDSHSSNYDKESFNVNEHKIDTEVEVKLGESILLGGMIYNQNEKVITKVPVLGDIPLIGGFFKNKKESKITKEVIFSIKPEIECK